MLTLASRLNSRSVIRFIGLAVLLLVCNIFMLVVLRPGTGSLTGDSAQQASIPGLAMRPKGNLSLGRIPCRSIAKFSAEVTNDSPWPIKLTDLSKTCGCTKVMFSPEILPAGARGLLTGAIRISQQSGDAAVRIGLTYADLGMSRRQSLTLNVNYHAFHIVTPDVTELYLQPDAATKSSAHKQVVFTNEHSEEVVLRIENTCKNISVDQPEVIIPSGSQHSVVFQTTADAGREDGEIALKVASSTCKYEDGFKFHIIPLSRVTATPRLIDTRSHAYGDNQIRVTLTSTLHATLNFKVIELPDGLSILSEDALSPGTLILVFNFDDRALSNRPLQSLKLAIYPEDGQWTEEIAIPVLGRSKTPRE